MPNVDELVLLQARPHPWLLVRIGLIFIFGAILPLIISAIFSDAAFGLYQNRGAATLILILWWLLLIIYILWSVRRWLSNLATVTDLRVIVESGGLNAQTEYSLPLEKIDTTSVSYSSHLNRLIKMGTVELKSGDQLMTLRHVYYPEKIVAAVTNAAEISSDHRFLTPAPIETQTTSKVPELSAKKSSEDLDEMTEGKAVYF